MKFHLVILASVPILSMNSLLEFVGHLVHFFEEGIGTEQESMFFKLQSMVMKLN